MILSFELNGKKYDYRENAMGEDGFFVLNEQKRGYEKVENVTEEMQNIVNNLKQIEDKKSQINEKLNYLKNTDWVVVKINEAKVQDEDVSPLLEKYSEVLANRKQVRDEINVLESEINSLKE